MKHFIAIILTGLMTGFMLAAPATADEDSEGQLTATFIGNEAFAITDGPDGTDHKVTLVSDFPYQSGYSLYMEYDPAALEITGEVVALVTHRHPDHFDPTLFLAKDWWIVGPREITDGISKSRVVPFSDAITYGDIFIRPVATEHSTTEHFSYLVNWKGKSLYFFGDTEGPAEFLDLATDIGGFDVVFMTPWVLGPLVKDGVDIPATKIVIYHQQVGEPLPQCSKCRALAQGESFVLD